MERTGAKSGFLSSRPVLLAYLDHDGGRRAAHLPKVSLPFRTLVVGATEGKGFLECVGKYERFIREWTGAYTI
jgi:hypothetical protein